MAAQEQDLDAIAAEISRRWMVRWTTLSSRAKPKVSAESIDRAASGRRHRRSGQSRAHMPEILQWQRERLVAKLEMLRFSWKTTVWSRSWFCWHKN